MSKAPRPSTFSPGGEGDHADLRCDRCGRKATKSYEGVECLDLCDACFYALGEWLDTSENTDESDGGAQ